jgi:Family of unknown function (DUF5684)
MNSGVSALLILLYLVIIVVEIASVWRVFTKAGQPGWASIIPIYNVIVMLRIANRPMWWFILYLIPGVNIIVGIIVIVDIAHAFGKSTGFAVGMILLSFIFFPILGFGSARYQGTTIGPAGPRMQMA